MFDPDDRSAEQELRDDVLTDADWPPAKASRPFPLLIAKALVMLARRVDALAENRRTA